jgi:ligand-binding sensor domain-containing protein
MNNFYWYLKVIIFFILSFLMINSCEKDDFSPVIHFDISGRLLEGKHIDCIDIDNKGNVYIASNKELYYTSTSNINHKNYNIEFPILDIAIAPDETLWIGTNGGGLGHLTSEGFTWYTKANAGLPRDYIRNVEVGSDGRIWFSSCAHDLGGLVVYDGKKFKLFTPDNSPMNQNVVHDIEIDRYGSVYIVSSGKVGRTNVYRISDNSWHCLGDEDGTFYWVFVFSVSPAGVIYLIEDFSLSSSSLNSNALFEYRDNTWQNVEADFISGISPFTSIKADKRNYCWLAGFRGNSPVLHVFNGEVWESSPEGILPDDFITTIETDNDNNIWVGTNSNGVFILNQ